MARVGAEAKVEVDFSTELVCERCGEKEFSRAYDKYGKVSVCCLSCGFWWTEDSEKSA